MGLTHKQRVKINAALSLIHSEGHNAQAVVDLARTYQKTGHEMRRSYELALNEFVGRQPELGNSLGKVLRLIEASDTQTVAKYETALNTYITTGDGSSIVALGPMIARDGVELAVRNGELPDRTFTAENIEAAVGFPMSDAIVAAAANPDVSPAKPDDEAPSAEPVAVSKFAFAIGQAQKPDADSRPRQPQPDQTPQNDDAYVGARSARSLLAGARRGDNGLSDRPEPQPFMSRADARAHIVGTGMVSPDDEATT